MYSMFDKKYVYFMPCGALTGCRVFYGDSIADIISDVESGETDRMARLAGCASGDDDEYPFKFSESEWRFVYHDPWYEEKLAFRRGEAVEYMDNMGKWHDADEEPDWTVYNNYRVKTSNWHYVGMDYAITDSVPAFWRFRGTLRQCEEWCANCGIVDTIRGGGNKEGYKAGYEDASKELKTQIRKMMCCANCGNNHDCQLKGCKCNNQIGYPYWKL